MIKGTPKSASVENRGITRLCDIGYTNLYNNPSYFVPKIQFERRIIIL